MSAGPEPIAIVGIGCRLPGGADSPGALWQLLTERFDAIGPVPQDRFDIDALYADGGSTPGRVTTRWGGFLAGVDLLDAPFFEIAPREADRLDPQQRLLLETGWEALEDAGIPQERVAGSAAAVYVGMWLNEFETRAFADPSGIDLYATTGTGRYTASGRLSFFLDLRGPSVTVDTACSSSLVAVHLACQSLRTGESDLALAGGANVILEPNITIAYSQSGMMAPDGRCKFGDAAADGYVRSDGAAIVVLKRLSSALADGDRIYAVIRGSAVTNDGRSSGFLATPGRAGQEEMLRRAYEGAGIEPQTVQYVEAHGTGTAAGDPVELGALGAVVGTGRRPDAPCLVGSLKSNVGHTEGAAGVAGLIKAALALQHGEVPASIHVAEPNPRVAWNELGLEVCTSGRPWPAHNGPRRAGVSSFGIAGTNAHVVLEEPPAARAPDGAPDGPLVLPISAKSPAALRALAGSYRQLLADAPEQAGDLCAAAATCRTHHDDRLAIAGATAGELVTNLDSLLAGAGDGWPRGGRGRAVFVFPGQGSQWLGMARELVAAEPTFRHAMDLADQAILAEAGWSPLAELAADEAASRLDAIDVVQPLLFAVQVALASLWRSWGVEPSAVVGHSMGEAAAAHVAGALSLADAVAVICRRSSLLRRVAGQGAMAVVDLGPDEAQAALAGFEDRLAVAVSNSPRSSVLSGDPAALDEVLEALAARDVFTRRVNVDVASHSPQVDPLLADLAAELAMLVPRPTTVPMYSTVDGVIVDGCTLGADYWVRNLRQPVRFGEAVGQLVDDGCDLFIELSPHPVLLPPIEEGVRAKGGQASAIASLRREQPERLTMFAGLGRAYERGCDVRWEQVVGGMARPVDLPTYPWQRERFWYEPARRAAGVAEPLLGHSVRLGGEAGLRLWETDLGSDAVAFLRDHVVLGSPVMPAAGFVEQALLAARHEGGDAGQLRDVELVELLPIEVGAGRAVQLEVAQGPAGALRFTVHSLPEVGGTVLHASGVIEPGPTPAPSPVEAIETIVARCQEHRAAEGHEVGMQARGLAYGPQFRTVTECWLGSGEALGRVTAPEAGAVGLLDGCLQVALDALPASVAGQTYLPVRIGWVRRHRSVAPTATVWAHAVLTRCNGSAASCDVTMRDADGSVLLEATGVELKRLGTSASRIADLFYELRWDEAALPDRQVEPGTWVVLAASDLGRDLATRLLGAGHRCLVVVPGPSFADLGDGTFSADPTSIDHHRAVLRAATDGGHELRGIVYALATELIDDASIPQGIAERFGAQAIVALGQAVATWADEAAPQSEPRWWLVTSGGQAVADEGPGSLHAAQAVVWGIGRVMASEHPERRCTLVDLDPARADARDLFDEITSGAGDQQLAWRHGRRLVPRLDRLAPPGGPLVGRELESDTFGLRIAEPGSLDTMHLAMTARRAPGPGEVEVRIAASGLNFLDVLKALGAYPGLEPGAEVALGAEGAGTVVRVGPGVTDVVVGDEVVALTSSYEASSLLASHAVVPAAFVAPRPPDLPPEVAAGLPVAYLTAYYALCELGRVRRGDLVLVHAAAGGVGLAAVELCRDAGATVLATAGSDAKRAYLRSLGIEHVFDSRTTSFAGEILAVTGGRGVDIVVNSLAGDAIPASLSVLAPGGRFIELGKRDVYAHRHLDLGDLKHNRAFHAVDLAALTAQRAEYVAELFHTVMGMVTEGRLGALPVTPAPITDAADTFRAMASGAHRGKLVLTTVDRAQVRLGVVRPDATYVITGGLGALGLAVARRFVAEGARHLLLVGRTAPAPAAEEVLEDLRRAGSEVRTVAADVTDPAALGAALAMARVTMPPVRGVVHAAGVLADATLGQLDAGRLHAALAPKLEGGWNLHLATLADPLELFVLFSSVAGVLGLAGQAAYAAGNAALDGLAHARRVAGRPALSIDWGPWNSIGLAAAASDRGERLAGAGLAGLEPDEALDALFCLLREDRSHVTVARLDASAWVRAVPTATDLLARLLTDPAGPVAAATWATWLHDLPAGPRRRAGLEDAICAELAPVLRADADRIDRHRELKAMGLDSLMALELRNRLEARTGLALSATLAWNHPTVEQLAEHLAQRMALPLVAATSPDEVAAEVMVASEVPEASEAELAALLADELAAVERLLSEGRAS